MDLQGLFTRLQLQRNRDLLVGIETGDDAAVYRLRDDLALVVTADFITPFTEDPFLFGQVAAANSISDVYAMGGKPVTALNLCMFPVKAGEETLSKILQGGLDKIHEAGADLVGGHTVRDDEMKYGLSVNGTVDPKHYTPNSGARPGDVFILTKPVGSGGYITAARKKLLGEEELRPVALKLAELNRVACETMLEFGSRVATDITGFGLGGHALILARASKLGIRFFYDAIPVFPRAVELLGQGMTTGLTGPNRKLLEGSLSFEGAYSDAEKDLFIDSQTSGGLFFGVPAKEADACVRKLRERGCTDAAVVAEAFASDPPRLDVVRSR